MNIRPYTEGMTIYRGGPIERQSVDMDSYKNKQEPLTDQAIFTPSLTKYYSNYMEISNQIAGEPSKIEDLVYQKIDKERADEILSFLEGKNATKYIYHNLLEKDTDQADLFIRSYMELDCYRSNEKRMDEHFADMEYNDFLKQTNKTVVDGFKNKIAHQSGSKDKGYYRIVISDALAQQTYLGKHFDAVRTVGRDNEYLSKITKTWISATEMQKELDTVYATESTENMDALKPVGYGNKDSIVYNFVETAYYASKRK